MATRSLILLVAAAAAVAVPAGWLAIGQGFSAQDRASSAAGSWHADGSNADPKDIQAVHYEYPEQVEIAAGKPSVVDLHFRIRSGLHINSHTPHEKSLIRTDLVVLEPPGIKIDSVEFPDGTEYSLKAFPNEKLSVYTDEFVLHAHVVAKPGEHLVQAALRYQACDTDSCYPPKKAPVAVDIVAR